MAVPAIPVIDFWGILRGIRAVAARVFDSKFSALITISATFGVVLSSLVAFFGGLVIPHISTEFIESTTLNNLQDSFGFIHIAKYILRIDLLLSILNFYLIFFETLITFILATSFSFLVLSWSIKLKQSIGSDIRSSAV